VTLDNGTDGQTDRQTDRRTDRVRRNMRPPPREEGRIIMDFSACAIIEGWKNSFLKQKSLFSLFSFYREQRFGHVNAFAFAQFYFALHALLCDRSQFIFELSFLLNKLVTHWEKTKKNTKIRTSEVFRFKKPLKS